MKKPISHSRSGMPQPFGSHYLISSSTVTIIIMQMMSMKNSCLICFSYSSVIEVHMLANDMLRPNDPFDITKELSPPNYCGGGAGGAATTGSATGSGLAASCRIVGYRAGVFRMFYLTPSLLLFLRYKFIYCYLNMAYL